MTWRDIGGGMIRNDKTGQEIPLEDVRPRQGRVIVLTDEEWSKLEKLARARNKTPEECVKAFIASCKPEGSGWVHPAEGGKNG